MPQLIAVDPVRVNACHDRLLGLAGKVPDEELTRARSLLADARLDEFQSVLGALGGASGPLDPDEGFIFLPLSLAQANDLWQRDCDLPVVLDLTAAGRRSTVDGPDLAAVATVRDLADVNGLWRAWRLPTGGAPGAAPRRVYLIEAGAQANRAAITGAVQRALVGVGELAPQVETFAAGQELPAYHREAIAGSALLWAAGSAQPIELVRVFDFVDPEAGAGFRENHPRVTDAAIRRRLLEYLDQGAPVLVTETLLDDVMDPARTGVVPAAIRTDGMYVWTDAVGYYLREHQLRPDPSLVARIAEAGYRMPVVDRVASFRALARVQSSTVAEPSRRTARTRN